jgi:hypothetical protein
MTWLRHADRAPGLAAVGDHSSVMLAKASVGVGGMIMALPRPSRYGLRSQGISPCRGSDPGIRDSEHRRERAPCGVRRGLRQEQGKEKGRRSV